MGLAGKLSMWHKPSEPTTIDDKHICKLLIFFL
jgi:hypothetical protein